MARPAHQPGASDVPRAPLLELDPELGSGLPDEERVRARALVVQPAIVEPGPWDQPINGFAMLVVEGLVVRETAVGGRLLPQVLGAGDVLEAWPDLQFEHGLDERFRRMWELYLALCEAGFRMGRINVEQWVFAR